MKEFRISMKLQRRPWPRADPDLPESDAGYSCRLRATTAWRRSEIGIVRNRVVGTQARRDRDLIDVPAVHPAFLDQHANLCPPRGLEEVHRVGIQQVDRIEARGAVR